MSGQPNRTPLDAAKFRQAYMSNLKLRIALDDKNLQANKIYKRTGQLPIEPSDFRTLEEKLKDVLTLRRDVRSQLGKITDGTNANKISVELSPPELVFYYQQSPTINQLIKERYSKGVLADIFIGFLQKYMADTLANKGVASGLQQVSGANLLLSGENIARGLATQPDYLGLLETYMNTGMNIARAITEIIDVLPPNDLFSKINAIANENEKFILLEEANNYLKDLPSKNEISSKIREVQRLKNIRDVSGLRGETDRVIQLITPSNDTKIQRANIIQALSRPPSGPEIFPEKMEKMKGTDMEGYTGLAGDDIFEGMSFPSTELGGVPQIVGINPDDEILSPSTPVSSQRNAASLIKTINDIEDLHNNNRFNKDELISIFNYIDDSQMSQPDPIDVYGKKNGILGISRSAFVRLSLKEQRKLIVLLPEDNKDMLLTAIQRLGGISKGMGITNKFVMTGRGIVVPKILKRYDAIKSSDIDTTMGLEKSPRYIPFGRYLINRNRLQDGVVSIKRPSGGAITEFPSQRVSSSLAEILKKIVGRGIPAFEDLETLGEEEKAYLHKLATQSQIIDRLSIPTPKKGEVDKDLNRFEILKGQITSGNDNKDLIKEFKLLIMKLSSMKIIPKTQARDILFDITSMGF